MPAAGFEDGGSHHQLRDAGGPWSLARARKGFSLAPQGDTALKHISFQMKPTRQCLD
jgi:hypothetical protein